MRRITWRFLYPFTLLLHKIFGLSYKWVNVGIGAWRRDLFDLLWHYEWYGDKIEELPESVILCGIRYHTVAREGLVQFFNNDMGVTRLQFERDPYDNCGALWYYVGGKRKEVPVAHIDKAYRWLIAVYGGSHEMKRDADTR